MHGEEFRTRGALYADAAAELAAAVEDIWSRHYRPAPKHWHQRNTTQADRLAGELIISFTEALRAAQEGTEDAPDEDLP